MLWYHILHFVHSQWNTRRPIDLGHRLSYGWRKVALVKLDLSKAFDKTPPHRLLQAGLDHGVPA
eukprot:3248762-Amphidinium_carterae.1